MVWSSCSKLQWITSAADHDTVTIVLFGGFSPLGSAWVAHRCPTTLLNVFCCLRGSTFHHTWRFGPKKDRFGCAKTKKNKPGNVTISVDCSSHGAPTFRAFWLFQYVLNHQKLHGSWRPVLLPSHAPFVMGQSPPGSSNPRPGLLQVDHFGAHLRG